jgi:hypothetical protein
MDNRIKYAKGFYDLYAGKGGEAGDGGKPIIEGKGSSVSSTSSSMSETLDSAKQMVNNVIATGSASSETVLQLIKIAIEYLSAIADNTGDTSDGIDELNKKSVNMINNTTNNTTNNNVVNNTNSNSTTGSTEDKSADRSKYSMAKRIAAGILT